MSLDFYLTSGAAAAEQERQETVQVNMSFPKRRRVTVRFQIGDVSSPAEGSG